MFSYMKPKQTSKNGVQMKNRSKTLISQDLKIASNNMKIRSESLTEKSFGEIQKHYNLNKPTEQKKSQTANQRPVVQMVRKRVSGVGGTFSKDDIYYDKSDGNYYNQIMKEGQGKEVKISKNEFEEWTRISAKEGRAEKTTILAEAMEEEQTKFVNSITGEQVEDGDNWKVTADVYAKGTKMATPPKAIRLYAEGDMTHALSLAEAFKDFHKFELFMDIDGGERVTAAPGAAVSPEAVSHSEVVSPEAAVHPEVLIKATEFEGKDEVIGRYGRALNQNGINGTKPTMNISLSKKKTFYKMGAEHKMKGQTKINLKKRVGQPYYDAGYLAGSKAFVVDADKRTKVTTKLNDASAHKRMETSFGGSTGDLARTGKEGDKRSRRKYDLIQATFFWLPQGTNDENFNKMKNFMLNQFDRLREDGKIKIVLTNKCKGKYSPKGKSQYSGVANKLKFNSQLTKKYTIDKKLLREKYSKKLTDLGMNEKGFKHTQTAIDKEVSSPQGDLIIEAKKKITTE